MRLRVLDLVACHPEFLTISRPSDHSLLCPQTSVSDGAVPGRLQGQLQGPLLVPSHPLHRERWRGVGEGSQTLLMSSFSKQVAFKVNFNVRVKLKQYIYICMCIYLYMK